MPAHGHDWNDTVYEWTDFHTSVTAMHTCRYDATHAETETVNVIAVILPPTESAEGSAVYTSEEFTKAGFSIQTKTITIPALQNMATVRLPEGLRRIEEEAFSNLTCQAVIIPDGCTCIGEHSFAGCSSLTYIRIPSSVTGWDDNVFEGCSDNLIIDWTK